MENSLFIEKDLLKSKTKNERKLCLSFLKKIDWVELDKKLNNCHLKIRIVNVYTVVYKDGLRCYADINLSVIDGYRIIKETVSDYALMKKKAKQLENEIFALTNINLTINEYSFDSNTNIIYSYLMIQ
jgi:hypothetical protein